MRGSGSLDFLYTGSLRNVGLEPCSERKSTEEGGRYTINMAQKPGARVVLLSERVGEGKEHGGLPEGGGTGAKVEDWE